MLIASRNDGFIPDDPAYVKRVAYLSKPPNFKPLIDSGFLCLASTCKQMLATARPETETETEGETDIYACEEPKKEAKKQHGEFGKVTLTDDEFSKLQKSYGQLLNQAIETLDAYMASKGKKYESCYAVMKKNGWVWVKVHMAAKPKDNFGRPVDQSTFAPDLGREEREREEYQRRLAKTMNDMRSGSAVTP